MGNAAVILSILGALILSACSRDPGDPPREPGTFFRTGGDVVNGGHHG